MVNDTPHGRWFRRVLWVAIAGNILMALPVIAAPSTIIALAGLAAPAPEIWPRLAAVQAIVLAALYVPAALDIDRYRVVAWLAVAAHVLGGMFFAVEPGFRLFAAYDFTLALSLGVLLTLASRSSHPAAAHVPAATL